MQAFSRKRVAFTLVEMIVVISIIALLAGLLLPMLVKSLRAARRTRTAANLNSIALGLEQYKTDFGDYPRLNAAAPLQPGMGFALLGFALIGPGPELGAQQTPTGSVFRAGTIYAPTGTLSVQSVAARDTSVAGPAAPDWAPFGYYDGADGPGFRSRNQTNITGAAGASIKTKVFGPYLSPEKFKMRGLAILDDGDNPILYYPASPAKLNLNASPAPLYVGSGPGVMMYNFDNNGTLSISLTPENDTTGAKALARMQAMLGAVANIGGASPGRLGNGDTPATTGPFILWSVGDDGVFGPAADVTQWNSDQGRIRKAVNACDDVTNFNLAK